MTQDQDRLDTFDEVWSLGDPAKIEKSFGELIPAAEAEPSKSTYLQILTQIALAKAIQKQFSDAHQTLDIAQQQLETENEIAGVRLLLERGRVYHQAGKLEEARPYIEQASKRGAAIGCDYLAIDAAHMVATPFPNPHQTRCQTCSTGMCLGPWGRLQEQLALRRIVDTPLPRSH